ncbi:MAG TPA: amidohydrolase family protein [Candidatus Acidoferrum sp.]|nr:amidohydrolase family protein [Candidatus Acidoferrum sp.]
MKIKLTAFLFFLLFFCPFTAKAQTDSAQNVDSPVTAIRAGKLIDTDAGKTLTDQIILIRGERIEAVGKDVQIPAGAKVIDLSNMTVLPGLIDCHTHLADGARDPSGDPLTYLKKTAAEVAFESVPNGWAMLYSGFTTVRDVGVYRALNDIAMRDAIARGDIIGPRMFVAGAYVTITGGAGALTGPAPDITLPWNLHYGQADGPWEVRAVIRKLANDGVDHIKILSSGAVLEHGSNPSSQEFTMEELEAAVDEAHHFGLRVACHAHSTQGIKNAILAGVTSVEHATMIDDEGIALAKAHGTYLVMDIYDEECIEADGRANAIPPDFLQHDAKLGQIQRDNFRKAVQAGVKLAFGTDAGVCAYGTSGKQFAYMVKYGMTPMQAIQSATSSAADLLGHSDEFGSIRTGKYADIVAVEGDPTQNVRLLENIPFVMKAGKVYKQQPDASHRMARGAPSGVSITDSSAAGR